MSGLLFVLDLLAVVLIAFWLWSREHPAGGRRVTLFDMTDDVENAPASAQATGPRWRQAVRTAPARSPRPGWRERRGS